MGRVYAGWGFSQAFYREKVDLENMGYASLEDFLVGFWENLFFHRDANNLLTMLWTWQQGDISNNEIYHGNFEKALASIKAKAIVIAGKHDLYFPPEDNLYEVKHMPNAEFRQTDSIWGHFAGGPGLNPDDVNFIDNTLKELLMR
jgi:homoserine O-acetyltransferase